MEECERVRGKERVLKNLRGKEGRRGQERMIEDKSEGEGMEEG
jgi:hypothetical protein